ncbi:MAG: hypothetical protein Q7S15_02740 [bacterium]|nr:hypothetical protein [bacterium]
MKTNAKLFLKVSVASFLILFVAGYSFYQARKLIAGPRIAIESPSNGAMLGSSIVEIVGKAENISFISMNDRPIYVDEQGIFKEKLLLAYGYNIIKVAARDKFGRNTVETLEVVYK